MHRGLAITILLGALVFTACNDPAADTTKRWILLCSEGYASSLAAASLVQLGLDATDIVGGIAAWQEVGLPVVSGPTDVGRFVG